MVSAIESNKTTDVDVLVTGIIKKGGTYERTPVANAFVELAVTNGSLSIYNGTTDSTGKFRTTFTAPYVPQTDVFTKNGSGILIEIKSATLEEYDDAPGKLTLLTAYPEGVDFLAVQMEADPDVIDDKDAVGTPGQTSIVVTVTDQGNNPASDAEVVIQVDPKDPSISPATMITDQDGKATFILKAADIDEDREYAVSVIALKDGYKNGTQSVFINVIDFEIIDPPNDDPVPYAWIAVAGFAILVVAAVVFKRLRP